MSRLSLLLMVVLCLAGCAHPPEAPASASLICNPYAGTAELLERADGHIIVLDEIHGTHEAPEAVRQLACAALEQGEPVRIGLEAVWTQGAPLDAALQAPFNAGAVFDAAPVMWTTLDGRGSGAMLDLLKQVAAWRADGLDVSVFAFDGTAEEWVDAGHQATARDAAMARHVDREAEDFGGVVLLLTGGFHARKQTFEFAGETYTPMASLITVRPVFSLQMIYDGGEAWVNGSIEYEDGTIVDSVGPMTVGRNSSETGAARSIALTNPQPEDFDGSYFTGPITASAPAFPDKVPASGED